MSNRRDIVVTVSETFLGLPGYSSPWASSDDTYSIRVGLRVSATPAGPPRIEQSFDKQNIVVSTDLETDTIVDIPLVAPWFRLVQSAEATHEEITITAVVRRLPH